ncbi:MAG: hypothetical protein A2287_00075 [Candidatus Melainabacteria bacterium RIFOXYA12_FULL_32_12]|nr:MAG: hypothetical protein A2255_10825 [Candidatus Melainabacteria bacterium RIFOXYA2_FULL_32_9]OGI31810.1 MAG: hypothetical protein A2287_00075 [Candidatus Melainabacteria bacterium RIFOXYA12_FULL_32_12]
MSKKTAILLGGNALSQGIIDKFRENNLKAVVIDWREKLDLDYDLHIKADAKSLEIIEVLDNYSLKDVNLVYTSMDNAGLALRALCKKFKLLHSSEESILNASSKDLMKRKWVEKKLFTRISYTLEKLDLEKIEKLNKNYKLIIKPCISCASRGITILTLNSSVEKIQEAYNKAEEESANKKVVVEEFVEGIEHTVEMLGDNFGNVAVYGISRKYHTQNTINNKVAVKLHYNSIECTDNFQKELANFAIECYKALGLKNSLGHFEVLLKNDGSFEPVEIGSRSSGFIASHLVDITSGRGFLTDYMQVLNGEKITNGLIEQTNLSSMYYFYDIPKHSTSKKKTNLMEYINPQIQSLYHSRDKLLPDMQYGMIHSDTERVGYEILKGPRNTLTIEEVNRAESIFIENFLERN